MKKKSDQSLIEAKPVPPYDPTTELNLDLTHDEKLRTTALMLAIQYYERTIVSDGALYSAMKSHGVELRPAHPNNVVDIASQFVAFLLGVPLTAEEMKAIDGEARMAPTEEPADKETIDYVKDYKKPEDDK
jgi:hypothetical protein